MKEYFESLSDFVNNEEESRTKEQIELLNGEIQKLSPRGKEIFLLCKFEGLTYIEVADHLNISTKTVENHMVKAFFILRKKLKEKMNLLIFLLFRSPKQVEL